ncbi:MAG: VIT and VWA domain-containing protein [Planctomycetota bacterium]|nr:VIT and VWA domain-containing protein [Planctomycetota bacterium]
MKSKKVNRWLVYLVVLATLPATTALACFMRSPLPVQVSADHIEVEIHDQVAIKRYRCVFYNPNPRAVVGGECFMEVEPGAQVDNMKLSIGGKEIHAEILDQKKANQVFLDMVKRGGSPALLEFYGNQLIRSKVPRIPAGGTVTVHLQYTTVLKSRDGLVRISMLNTNPKAKMQALKEASIQIRISSKKGIQNVYSPTHDIKIVEDPKADVAIKWSQKNYLPKSPFVLYYALSEEAVGMNLLTHREKGEPGTFMLMLSPSFGDSGEIASGTSKDVVFCVDTSGSMLEGGLIGQARQALTHCLERLGPGDRFNIVSFGTEARLFEESLQDVDEISRKRALRYVQKKMQARGGTAIEEALGAAIGQFTGEEARPRMIVFLTDGRPSIGERNPDKLLAGVAKTNRKDVRIFTFGIGHQVDTRFLDLLADKNGGESDYVHPKEAIGDRIAPFFAKVASPVLTQVRVRIRGVEVEDLYPKRLPDLFRGGQLTLLGRYQGSGTAEVEVTAMRGEEEVRYVTTIELPEEEERSEFVPRVWAGKKVAHLLNELREGGSNQELVDEVVRLARRYGIVTPYTSYLVVREGALAGGKSPAQLQRKMKASLGRRLEQDAAKGLNPGAPKSQALHFNEASRLREFRNASGRAGGLYDMAESEAEDKGLDRHHAMRVLRYVGSRTFYRSGDGWIESTYEEAFAKKVTELKLASEEYLALVQKHPTVTKYLALGQVVFTYHGAWYKIVE